ncbi:MAG TPA: hypothetical protein VEL76_43340 [Gemmataceae bacterium]|nr:hypothetical protein [Gemmataceae bacterium]
MASNAGKTVAEILKGKKGSLKQAPLPKGSPSWDEILPLTWEEIDTRAKRRERGYKTIRKLLSDPEYNK